uniref:hypothetical protein n=1 Tax=Pseudorhodoferax sp. TaxID=1993553 RepID=UPI002DD6591D
LPELNVWSGAQAPRTDLDRVFYKKYAHRMRVDDPSFPSFINVRDEMTMEPGVNMMRLNDINA